MKTLHSIVLIAVILISSASMSLQAQSQSFTGTVTDQNGNPVVNYPVSGYYEKTGLNLDPLPIPGTTGAKGIIRKNLTDSSGQYSFSQNITYGNDTALYIVLVDLCGVNDTTFFMADSALLADTANPVVTDFQICVDSTKFDSCNASYTFKAFLQADGKSAGITLATAVDPDNKYRWTAGVDGTMFSSGFPIGYGPIDTISEDDLDNFSGYGFNIPITATINHCLEVEGYVCEATECNQFKLDSLLLLAQDCIANSHYSRTGLNVSLTDASLTITGNAPDSILWEFGDGATASGPSVTHQYAQGGHYKVTHTIVSGSCSSTRHRMISVIGAAQPGQCFANFDAQPAINSQFGNYLGLNDVIFYDNSQGTMGSQQYTASLDFGDGTTGTLPTNGYLVHTYPDSGSYDACLTVTDTGGCSNTLCRTVSLSTPSGAGGNSSLTGTVTKNGQQTPSAHAEVFVVTLDPQNLQLSAIDTLTLAPADSGVYNFTVPNNKQYFIKAALLPQDADYATNLPTYYGGSNLWYGAAGLFVPQPGGMATMNLDIPLAQGSNSGGPGFVSGSVTAGAGKTTVAYAPIPMVLMDPESMQPVAFAYTQPDGSYSIDNLPYGTYLLHAGLTGVYAGDHQVTLSPDQPGLDDANFDLEDLLTDRKATLPAANLKVYPNPTDDNLRITGAKAIQASDIQIYDLNARELTVAIERTADGVQVSTAKLPTGVYMLRVRIEGQTSFHKVVVAH